VNIIVPPCPFKTRHFETLFNTNYIKIPKKKKFKKKKIIVEQNDTEIDPNQFINIIQ